MDPDTHPCYNSRNSRLPGCAPHIYRPNGYAVNHHVAQAHCYRAHNHCCAYCAAYHTDYCAYYSPAAYHRGDLSSSGRGYLLG